MPLFILTSGDHSGWDGVRNARRMYRTGDVIELSDEAAANPVYAGRLKPAPVEPVVMPESTEVAGSKPAAKSMMFKTRSNKAPH